MNSTQGKTVGKASRWGIGFLLLLALKGGRALNLYMRQQEAKSQTAYTDTYRPSSSVSDGHHSGVSWSTPPGPAVTVEPIRYTDGDIAFAYPGSWEIVRVDNQFVELSGPNVDLNLSWEHVDFEVADLFKSDFSDDERGTKLIHNAERELNEMLSRDGEIVENLARVERATVGDYPIIGYVYEATIMHRDSGDGPRTYSRAVQNVACGPHTICTIMYTRIDGAQSSSNDWQQLDQFVGSISFTSGAAP